MTSVVSIRRRSLIAAAIPSLIAVVSAVLIWNYAPVKKPNVAQVADTIAPIVTSSQTTPQIVVESRGSLDSDTAFKFIRSIVQIRTAGGGGAGVILRSIQGNDKLFRTFILTAAHVVHDAPTVEVLDFNYQRRLYISYVNHVQAKVVGVSEPLDVALLEIVGKDDWGRTTELVRSDTLDGICLHDPVYVVGCPALEPPSITDGGLVGLTRMLVRVSAPATCGNSGGAILLQDGRMIGLLTGMRAVRSPLGLAVVNHMAFGTATPPIALWLKCIGAGFLVGEKDKTVESFEQKNRPVANIK